MPNGQETRVVDPNTGGAKGSKLARFDLLPWTILREVAEHFGRGARKYDERNWERGYAWSLSFAALHRHLDAFWARDSWDMDPSLFDEGQPMVSHSRHIIAVVWHALVLAFFEQFNRGTDDRPSVLFKVEQARETLSPEIDLMLQDEQQRPIHFGGVELPRLP